MKKLFVVLLCFSTTLLYSQTEKTVAWATAFSGKDWDVPSAIALDSNRLYVGGGFSDTLRVAGQELVSRGDRDIFLACFTTEGGLLWLHRAGGNNYDMLTDLATDSAGNVFATGCFRDTIRFENDSIVGVGFINNFVAKYSPEGRLLWLRHIVGGCRENELWLTFDSRNRMFLAGAFYDSLSVGNQTHYSKGSSDMFVTLLDSDGNIEWFKQIGGVGKDKINRLILRDSMIYLAGSFSDSLFLGNDTLVSHGYKDMFAAAMTLDTVVKWTFSAGGNFDDAINGLSLDSAGNVYFAANFVETCYMGVDTLRTRGVDDACLVRLDTAGNVQWIRQLGGISNDYSRDLVIDKNQQLFWTGTFKLKLKHEGLEFRSSNRQSDIFICRYDTAGIMHEFIQAGGSGEDYPLQMLRDTAEHVYLLGVFNNDWQSLGSGITGQDKDIFVACLGTKNDTTPTVNPPRKNAPVDTTQHETTLLVNEIPQEITETNEISQEKIEIVGQSQVQEIRIEPTETFDIKAYPNPAREWLYVDFGVSESVSVRYEIINSLGVVVESQTLGTLAGSIHQSLAIGHLTGGMYYLRLYLGNKVRQTIFTVY